MSETETKTETKKYQRKVFEALPDNAFAMEDVPETEAAIQVNEITRSDDQRRVDADVLAAHVQWVASGKPVEFNKSPRKRYVVDPQHVEAIKAMLTRAGSLHKVNVKVAPVKRHESGKAMIYFVAKDRQPRADKPANGTPSSTQTPPATPPATPPKPGPAKK
jgi:hypothetical protein